MNNWQQAAFQYMQDNIGRNEDLLTGEADVQRLAEDFLWNHPMQQGYNPTVTIDQERYIFEIAFVVAEMGAGRMTETEAKKYIEDYGGE